MAPTWIFPWLTAPLIRGFNLGQVLFPGVHHGKWGATPYDGGYSIDDVTLWFVPNDGAPASVTEIGTNILKDGDFNAKVEDANYYNTQKAEGDAWYVATSNDAATGEPLVAATVEKETLSAVDTTIVHNGTGALHITNRPGVQQSIAVDLKDVVNSVGKLSKDEHYYISVWVRAETGTIKVQPIFGCSLSATMATAIFCPAAAVMWRSAKSGPRLALMYRVSICPS